MPVQPSRLSKARPAEILVCSDSAPLLQDLRVRQSKGPEPLRSATKSITLIRFVWDPKKAASNLRKHGVSFLEAVTVFADPLALVVADALYRDRAVLIGQSEKQQLLVTVFVELNEDWVRIISARRATSHERKQYEEGEW